MRYYLEAEYDSGYVHRQDEQDHSPYVKGRNIFYDILHKEPEKVHGRMTRFSLIGEDARYDIDWTPLPDNARPIHAVDMEADMVNGEIVAKRETKRKFGYQFTDDDGKNVKEIKEII